MMEALRAEILVQMQRDLAVRTRAQPVTTRFELALDALVVVELAVDDDVQPLVLVGDRLVAGRQVDDAQPGMPQADASMGGDPLPLPVRPAVVEPFGRAAEQLGRDRLAIGVHRHDAAHPGPPR